MKLVICIRASGERTLEAVREVLSRHGAETVVISEAPFSKAVRRTFEVGLEHRCDLLIACDADVIPSPRAVDFLLDCASKSNPNAFMLQGRIHDKFWGGPRPGGVRAFRGRLLESALNAIPQDGPGVNRPEASTVLNMKRRGNPFVQCDEVLAVHDFEQYYRDIFRKVVGQLRKHARYLERLSHYWEREAPRDHDFAVAAWCHRNSRHGEFGENVLDARAFSQFSADRCLKELGFVEKNPLQRGELPWDFADAASRAHAAPPEYLQCLELMSQRPSLAARLGGLSKRLFQVLKGENRGRKERLGKC